MFLCDIKSANPFWAGDVDSILIANRSVPTVLSVGVSTCVHCTHIRYTSSKPPQRSPNNKVWLNVRHMNLTGWLQSGSIRGSIFSRQTSGGSKSVSGRRHRPSSSLFINYRTTCIPLGAFKRKPWPPSDSTEWPVWEKKVSHFCYTKAWHLFNAHITGHFLCLYFFVSRFVADSWGPWFCGLMCHCNYLR